MVFLLFPLEEEEEEEKWRRIKVGPGKRRGYEYFFFSKSTRCCTVPVSAIVL